MPSPMSLGITSKLYINTGSSYGAPVWTELNLISDLKVGGKWNEGESSARITRVQTFEPTNFALELTGKVRKNVSHAAYIAVQNAYLAGGLIDVLVLDGKLNVNTSQGYRFEGCVFDMSEDQGLQAVVFNDFTIKPSAQSWNLPAYCIVSGGVPTYQTFAGNS